MIINLRRPTHHLIVRVAAVGAVVLAVVIPTGVAMATAAPAPAAPSGTVGIVNAVPAEQKPIVSLMTGTKHVSVLGYDFITGKIGQQNVVDVACGEVDETAELCTYLLDQKFDPKAVILDGSAGSQNNAVKVGDVVVGGYVVAKSSITYGAAQDQSPYHGVEVHDVTGQTNLAGAIINGTGTQGTDWKYVSAFAGSYTLVRDASEAGSSSPTSKASGSPDVSGGDPVPGVRTTPGTTTPGTTTPGTTTPGTTASTPGTAADTTTTEPSGTATTGDPATTAPVAGSSPDSSSMQGAGVGAGKIHVMVGTIGDADQWTLAKPVLESQNMLYQTDVEENEGIGFAFANAMTNKPWVIIRGIEDSPWQPGTHQPRVADDDAAQVTKFVIAHIPGAVDRNAAGLKDLSSSSNAVRAGYVVAARVSFKTGPVTQVLYPGGKVMPATTLKALEKEYS